MFFLPSTAAAVDPFASFNSTHDEQSAVLLLVDGSSSLHSYIRTTAIQTDKDLFEENEKNKV
jgi:hypothetical protein